MNNKVVAVIFSILLAVSSAFVIIGNDGTNAENRENAKLPQISRENIVSGAFAKGTEDYINDRILYRGEMIDLSDAVLDRVHIKSPDGTVIRANTDMGTGTKQPSDLLVVDNTIMEMFADKKSCAEEYAHAVNTYAKNLSKDIKLYSMLIPTQLEFKDKMYSNLQDSQRAEIDYINSLYDKRVQAIDVYDILSEHTDEYIYFRTDHHWTMRGAYYGYVAFSKATGQDYVDIDDFKENKIEGFLGYLYSFVRDKEIEKNPDTIYWYDTNENGNITWQAMAFNKSQKLYNYNSRLFDKTRENYNFFLSASHPLACYTNKENADKKTILLIGDSYINTLVPWLVNNYKNVVTIDPRAYTGDIEVALSKYEPDEVMLTDYIFTTSFSGVCQKIEGLWK